MLKRLILVGLVVTGLTTVLLAPTANSPWQTDQIGVAIAVQKGMTVSAWETDWVKTGYPTVDRGSETGPKFT